MFFILIFKQLANRKIQKSTGQTVSGFFNLFMPVFELQKKKLAQKTGKKEYF
jgi:hypothetical protein